MTIAEQDTLFKTLKERFPNWRDRFTSGYVHGAALYAEGVRLVPALISKDEYGHGMMLAYAVRSGTDIEGEKWFGRLGNILA